MEQIWAAVIPASIALIAVLLNVGTDNLRKAERLTGIYASMVDSSERQLIQDLRDDYITTWALRQMAPPNSAHRGWAIASYIASALAFAIWAASVLVRVEIPSPWWFYGAGLALATVGIIFQAIRRARRNSWMNRERDKRWLRRPFHSRIRATTDA